MRPLYCFFLLWFAVPALAHTKSTSYSNWRIDGGQVRLTFTIPVVESARLKDSSNDSLSAYLSAQLWPVSANARCPPLSRPRPLAATAQFRRFEVQFACPDGRIDTLHDSAFFEFVPSHVNLAQVEFADGRLVEQLFTRDAQQIAIGEVTGAIGHAGFFKYVQLGIMHIFTGVDHMAFLLGLVLIARRARDLVFVVTGFTMGHSITLALAVTGVIRPHAEFIDALVALTIAMIGAENVAVATHRSGVIAIGVGGALLAMAAISAAGGGGLPPLILLGAGVFAGCYLLLSGQLRDAARLRLVVTMVFGLIHGFGFAADLLEQRLPAGQLASILFGFNLGVELGQLSLVFALLGLTWWLRRMRWSLPRPIVVDTVSAGLVGLGVFWFIGRSYA